jgi:hypothetical protein
LGKELINKLINFIVGYATQNEMDLTTLRLVKFLYLADLFYARSHSGKILTNFPWSFIYYGPYCSEAWTAIQHAERIGVICKRVYDSKFSEDETYSIFYCSKDIDLDEIENIIPLEVLMPLKAAIKKYGEDTPMLLDHVYFETEPMEDARKGEILDFSKAKPLTQVSSIKLKQIPKEKINLAKEHIKSLERKISEGRLKLERERLKEKRFKDDLYYQALEMLDEEDIEPGLQGVAEIEI